MTTTTLHHVNRFDIESAGALDDLHERYERLFPTIELAELRLSSQA